MCSCDYKANQINAFFFCDNVWVYAENDFLKLSFPCVIAATIRGKAPRQYMYGVHSQVEKSNTTQHNTRRKKKYLKKKNEPRAAPITPNQCRAFVNKNIDANQQTIWTTPGIRNIRTCHFIFSDFIVTPVVSLFLLCYKTLNLFFHCFIFFFSFSIYLNALHLLLVFKFIIGFKSKSIYRHVKISFVIRLIQNAVIVDESTYLFFFFFVLFLWTVGAELCYVRCCAQFSQVYTAQRIPWFWVWRVFKWS